MVIEILKLNFFSIHSAYHTEEYMLYSNNLMLVFLIITLTIFLILPISQIHASESVVWKIFNERNGLFAIKYPSNWSLGEYYENSSAPINMYFLYQGKGSSYAQLTIYAEESLFSNITALVENELTYINNQNYQVLQPTQCGNYTIKNVSACDVLVTYKGLPTEGEPTIKDLVIGALDEQGYEYIINYHGTENLYDHFFPVANEMIRSFNISQTRSFSGDESQAGLPGLPPLP